MRRHPCVRGARQLVLVGVFCTPTSDSLPQAFADRRPLIPACVRIMCLWDAETCLASTGARRRKLYSNLNCRRCVSTLKLEQDTQIIESSTTAVPYHPGPGRSRRATSTAAAPRSQHQRRSVRAVGLSCYIGRPRYCILLRTFFFSQAKPSWFFICFFPRR